jgi:flagellar basal-body rod protein FlgF
MELTSYVALSYLAAKQRSLDVTAANLANAGTSGFKAERVLFSDWLDKQAGAGSAAANKPIAFVQDRATWRERDEGPLQHTGNPLDLAINGDGFFTVDTPRGPRLTRAGRFVQQSDGTVVDGQGNALLDDGGQKLRLSPADLALTVTADGQLSSENGPIGRIGIVQPADMMKLQSEGGTDYRADTATAPVAQPRVLQGVLEDSNVQPIIEMTTMMDGLRNFELTAQMVEQEGQRLQSAIDKLSQQKG